jgi:hypothetical protein
VYLAVLHLHSLLRWAVLVLALVALASSAAGWAGNGSPRRGPRAVAWLVAALDLQLLAGLTLYFWLSPLARDGFARSSPIVQDPSASYWTLIHPLLALSAIALAHAGKVLSRHAADARSADRRATIFLGGTLLALLAATPWPFLAVGRGLWP